MKLPNEPSDETDFSSAANCGMQPARNQPARDARAVPLTRLSYADGSSVQHGEPSGGERVLLTATPWPGGSRSNATLAAA